jgi:hypothetical protein
MEPTRTDYLVGTIDAHALAAAYECGHCNSTTELRTINGLPRIAVFHDDGCPVLTGVLRATPDTVRAVATTFRGRPS